MAEEPWLEWGSSLHIGKRWFLWVPAFDPYNPVLLEALAIGHPMLPRARPVTYQTVRGVVCP